MTILDNAVKYTPENGSIRMRSRSENESLIIEVQDTGIGIAEKDLPNIFERFYRADQARTGRASGAGLGLSIAKWIAEAHRGSVQALSAVGEGSLFRVTFPLTDDPRVRLTSEQEVQHSSLSAD